MGKIDGGQNVSKYLQMIRESFLHTGLLRKEIENFFDMPVI